MLKCQHDLTPTDVAVKKKIPYNFCFITCTVCPLQSGASVQFQLLPQRESASRRVSQLTPLMEGGMEDALNPAGLWFSKLLGKQVFCTVQVCLECSKLVGFMPILKQVPAIAVSPC